MQPVAQTANTRQQSGSRVPPNGVHKLSLLGQQLTHFPGSSQQSQAVAPSPPPASNTVSLHGFSTNGHTDPLSIPPSVQAHFQTHLAGANGFQTPLHPWQAYNLQISSQMAHSLPESVHTHDLSRTVPSPSLVNIVAVLQQKIEQLQAHVQSIVQAGQSNNAGMAHQQTVMAARLASSISQLALTMAGMLPSPQQHTFTFQAMPQYTDLQFSHLFGAPLGPGLNLFQQGGNALGTNTGNGLGNLAGGDDDENRLVDRSDDMPVDNGPSRARRQGKNSQATSASNGVGAHGALTRHAETKTDSGRENHDMQRSAAATNGGTEDVDSGAGSREDEDDGETEDLVPGTYDLVEMNAVEILAEHTHFCDICGKGFKRDANLRMHMRGHGDEYKTAAALARPDRYSQDPSVVRPRRYSCPYVGCKRNKKHRKFQPLKTVLCVKNHYRRSHCPKSLTCGKCKSKKFSVVADLKTHEKHCGCEKWLCSCGTTFSRKDKLLGHIGLFQGHKPALPLHEMEGSVNPGDTAGNLGTCNGNKGLAVEPMDESGFSSPKAMKSVKGSDEKMISSSESPRSRSYLQVQGGTSLLQGLFSENFLQNESQPRQHKLG